MNAPVYYSVKRLALAEFFVASIVIGLLTPGFGNGLVYTAFLFKADFIVLRLIIILVLTVLFFYGLGILLIALRGIPMVKREGEFLQINRIKLVQLKLSDISSVEPYGFRSVVIRVKRGAAVVLLLSFCNNYKSAVNHLQCMIYRSLILLAHRATHSEIFHLNAVLFGSYRKTTVLEDAMNCSRRILTIVSMVSWTCSFGIAKASEVITYTYDPLGRFTTSSYAGGSNNGMIVSYQRDQNDNRIQYVVTGSQNHGIPDFGVIVLPLNGYTIIPIIDY